MSQTHNRDTEAEKTMGLGKVLLITGGAAAGGVGALVLLPAVLMVAGFTPGGMVALSYAPSLIYAIATGGLMAYLQSAALAGLSVLATAVVASVGGSIGAVVGWLVSKLYTKKKKEEEKKKKEEEEEGKKE